MFQPKFLQLSEECGIRTVQVSLDGPESVFRRFKAWPDGYRRTLEHLAHAVRFFDVKIRIHCHTENLALMDEVLEDLVAAAVNDAVRKVETTVQEKMAGVTAGLPLPPGMKLPF